MPAEDASRWNARYQAETESSSRQPSQLLVDSLNQIPTHGLALDIAMGLGRNAGLLLEHGLRVIGVDISFVAVCRAKIAHPTLMAAIVDLERFRIPEGAFDVIIDSLYLQRNLWLPLTLGLKPGGVLFIECLTEDMLAVHPEIDPGYLLKSGELRQAFMDPAIAGHVEILAYSERWNLTSLQHRRATACLVARRIA